MQEPRIVKRSVSVGFVLCLCSFLNHVVALMMLLLTLATGSSTRLVSENPVSRVAGHFSTRLVPKIVQQCIFPEVARRLHLARTERVPIEVDLMSKAMLDSIDKQQGFASQIVLGPKNGKQLMGNAHLSAGIGPGRPKSQERNSLHGDEQRIADSRCFR